MNDSKLKFLTSMFIQFIANILILFDVPVARQIISFIYFTIMPGLLIIKLINQKELDKIETLVFSVGLSISFLMIAGLLINETGFLFGIREPLSLLPLLVIFNSFILVCTFLAYLQKHDYQNLLNDRFNVKLKIILILLFSLPVFSIFGALWLSIFGNNVILLFVIALIALLTFACLFFKAAFPQKLHGIIIFVITISILFHSAFISKYLISYGSDISHEYFLSEIAKKNAYWNSTLFTSPFYGRINSMLSLTVLPTVYSNLLNMDSIYVLKILYPTIFSFVPLTLFQFWRKKFGRRRSFFAAFLLVSSLTFYSEMLGLGRQMIAEVFLALLLLNIFERKKTLLNKIFFIVFSFALIVSHYALAEFFLGFVSITLVLSILLGRFQMEKSTRNLTVTMVAIFFVMMFSWYIYTSRSATFEATLSYGSRVIEELDEFFNPSSRDPTVLRAMGLESPPSIWNLLSRIFAYFTEIFIVLGFIRLVTKQINLRLEKEHFILIVVSMGFLILVILLPSLSRTFNVTRFYHILLFFLAPLFALGVDFLIELLFKQEKKHFSSALLLSVIIPYFLFQSGFVYELTGTESWAPISFCRANKYKLYAWFRYVDEQSSSAAKWISRNINVNRMRIYADISSRYTLLTHGLIHDMYIYYLFNTTRTVENGIVYLNSLNSIYSTVVTSNYNFSSEELTFLKIMNKVFSDGGAEVYKSSLKI